MTKTKKELHEKIVEIQNKYTDLNLVNMIHSFLQKEDQDNQQKRVDAGRVGKFYPSSVGRCKRSIVYQMNGYPGKPKEGKNLLILENGTSFHDRMEAIFERMGILIAPELKLTNDDLRISGRSDAIIWNFLKNEEVEYIHDEEIELYKPVKKEVDGVEQEVSELVYKGPASDVMIVEFKSIKSKAYHDYLPKTKPKKEHEMQLQLYFYLTGIRTGMVFYESKDNQEEKYYHVEYNQKIVDEIISDIRLVIDHVDGFTFPEREYDPTSFECRYCDYRDICHPIINSYNVDEIIG